MMILRFLLLNLHLPLIHVHEYGKHNNLIVTRYNLLKFLQAYLSEVDYIGEVLDLCRL